MYAREKQAFTAAKHGSDENRGYKKRRPAMMLAGLLQAMSCAPMSGTRESLLVVNRAIGTGVAERIELDVCTTGLCDGQVVVRSVADVVV